jgi:DNA-damage-inducible protein D
MKSDLIQSLTEDFEGHAQQTEGGVEYWLARDLQHLLGYAEWRNFNQSAISKAKTACEVSGHAVTDHFVDVNKMIQIGQSERCAGMNISSWGRGARNGGSTLEHWEAG